MASIFQFVKRAFWTPHFVGFAIIATPVIILAVQMKPASQEDLVQDMRKRYGYQYEQETKARNAKVMEQLFENRHKPMSEYTAGFQGSPKTIEKKKE